MLFSESEILDFIEENDVKFIRLTFCDTFGNMRNIAILPRELHRAISSGIPFNATGVLASESRPLLLKPDISTLSILPWRPSSGRVVRFFCNLFYMDGTPYQNDLRAQLHSTTKELFKKGYQVEMGTRCEFYLFKTDLEGNPTRTPVDQGGYLDVAPLDGCENTRRDICLTLEQMEIEPQKSCHKRGPGQNEIDFATKSPLTAADNMVHYKTVVQTIAAQNGQYASFMPLPFPRQAGSALKISLSIQHNDKSIFGNSIQEMSEEGKSFIAGILNRIRDFTLFTNPTINSYDRLHSNTAPNSLNWSDENRVPLIQLLYAPGIEPSIEVRSADAYCNPYIAFQLILKAGMEGIAQKEQLTEDTNASSDKAVFRSLPRSLSEAIDLAKHSEFIKSHLREDLIQEYIKSKSIEVEEYQNAEDPSEFCMTHYF